MMMMMMDMGWYGCGYGYYGPWGMVMMTGLTPTPDIPYGSNSLFINNHH